MKKQIKTSAMAFLLAAGLCPFVSAQDAPETEEEADKPVAYLQILNGIACQAVAVAVDGKVERSKLDVGSVKRVPIKQRTFTVSLKKFGGSEKKDFEIVLPKKGFFTLVLTGDFTALPPKRLANGTTIPDYRVKAELLPNEKPEGQMVTVRVVNGTFDRSITISRDEKRQLEVTAGSVGVAPNQPAALFLEASSNDWSSGLYLEQESPAANLTIVFWPTDDGLDFRAMRETTTLPRPAPVD